jgi:hypothetical protein
MPPAMPSAISLLAHSQVLLLSPKMSQSLPQHLQTLGVPFEEVDYTSWEDAQQALQAHGRRNGYARRNGSEERFHQRFQGQANSHTNHLGKFIGNPGFIPRGRLQWNTPQVSVGYARGFNGGWGVVCSSPWPRPTFSENPGRCRARRKILAIIGREFWDFWDLCIIRRIVRGCTNHAPRTMLCDPVACED